MTPNYTYRATVVRIIDGDTLDLNVDLGFRAWRMKERFRLAGINAPESNRAASAPAGKAARDYLSAMLPAGCEVTIQTAKDPDNFGRWIATVWHDGACLNDALVEAGHAVRREYK